MAAVAGAGPTKTGAGRFFHIPQGGPGVQGLGPCSAAFPGKVRAWSSQDLKSHPYGIWTLQTCYATVPAQGVLSK